ACTSGWLHGSTSRNTVTPVQLRPAKRTAGCSQPAWRRRCRTVPRRCRGWRGSQRQQKARASKRQAPARTRRLGSRTQGTAAFAARPWAR
ncbi:unnamed protein product, partial [Symbiodinium necroappetens]